MLIAGRVASAMQRAMRMIRRSRPSFRLWLSVGALAISGALGTLGCGAASGLSKDGAADRGSEHEADLGTSEIHDGGADLSRDAPADAASESPAALSCAVFGCAAPPRCNEGCQAPCGCCPCAEGALSYDVSGYLRCTGGCYVDETDGGANGCVNEAPISKPPPPNIGCYFGTAACGWQKVECGGELDVKNPSAATAKVQFVLTLVPSTVIPALAGTPDVEIAFDDPDGTWAATWSAQAGSGTTFIVRKDYGNPNVGGAAPAAGMTTVRLGIARLALAPVSLSALQSTVVQAAMNGAPTSARLSMEAVVTDAAGRHLEYDMGTCQDEPPPE
jgi:hypothetical protein